jgi:hypothetical protein
MRQQSNKSTEGKDKCLRRQCRLERWFIYSWFLGSVEGKQRIPANIFCQLYSKGPPKSWTKLRDVGVQIRMEEHVEANNLCIIEIYVPLAVKRFNCKMKTLEPHIVMECSIC